MEEIKVPGVDDLLALDDVIDLTKALPAIVKLFRDAAQAYEDRRFSLVEIVRLGRDFLQIVAAFKRNKP